MPFVAKRRIFLRVFCLIMKNLHSPRRFFTNLRDAVELPNLIGSSKGFISMVFKGRLARIV